MQPHLYTPTPEIDAGGEFPVYLNTESPAGIFGVIDFGPGTYLHVPAADAERIIRALAKVTAFDRAYRRPHAFEPGDYDSRCAQCGTGSGNAVHAPGDGKDEPASPDAAEALIDAIVAGTPVKVTDDRCECGHPARVHNFADVGTRGFCHECDAGSCKQYRDAGDVAVTA